MHITRILRRKMTPWERKLWNVLKNRGLKNAKFRRQFKIGNYIVDFCCLEAKLVVELDGGHHSIDEHQKQDKARQEYIENLGFKVLRFWNNDIDNNLNGVIYQIDENLQPHLNPLRNRRGNKHKMKKIKLFTVSIAITSVLAPMAALALEMPAGYLASEKQATGEPDEMGITAYSYLVMDGVNGQVLLEKNAKELWAPASLTKLVTAMVLLDLNPDLGKAVIMKNEYEVGGVRFKSASNISFRFIDLLHASLIASANNATQALARSTGWTIEEFTGRMNLKVMALGAQNTFFVEPTGLSERNATTAEDYAKIVKAAFEYPLIEEIVSKKEFSFGALNSSRYWQKVVNTNNILNDENFNSLIGKTGYIEVSKYNFATEVKDKFGNDLTVVVLGSRDSKTRFSEARKLAMMGGLAKVFPGTSLVLGASIQADIALRNLRFK